MNSPAYVKSEYELPQLLSVQQAAERLGVCRRTVERMFASGELAAVKIRGATRVEAAELVGYVEGLRRRS